MKVFIIVIVMGLISIFDCKVGGGNLKEVLGAELIDQGLWNDAGLAYWDGFNIAGWVGDGVKVSQSSGVGHISKLFGFVIGKKYKVSFHVDYVEGWFESGGFNKPGYLLQVDHGGDLSYYVVADGYDFFIEGSGFTGDVTSVSVREVNYIEEE